MQLYLPIAEMSVNPLIMLGIGLLIGCISGLFGIGGGFLLTPLLILTGIPASIAIVSGASVSAAASMSSFIPQWERRSLDLRMALLMSLSGVIGVSFGSWIFSYLQSIGFSELIVRISYVVLLGFVGISLLREAVAAIKSQGDRSEPRKKSNLGYLLPIKMKFPRSKLYISIIPPISIAFIIGILSAIMGVGGGFLLIPALIYIVHVPPSLVAGTSIFQVLILSSTTTFLQASANGGLDLVLSAILIIGAVSGAQLGTIVGKRLKGEQLRLMLGFVILALTLVLALELVLTPSRIFTTSSAGGGL